MTNEKCGEFWPPVEYLTENMVCAGGEKSGCQGDSGKDPQCALNFTYFIYENFDMIEVMV